MDRISLLSVSAAFVISLIVIYLFVDLAGQLKGIETEKDRLGYELDVISRRYKELNGTLLECQALAETHHKNAEDYYNKWQAERTIAYALWQMFDSALNITWEGQDYTQVNLMIPRVQYDYLKNLSETYGLNYGSD